MSGQNKKSKPGAVGNNMPGALKGDQDNIGAISSNYKGPPRNAIPGKTHESVAQSVSDWTKDHLKKKREEAAIKRQEGN